MANYSKADRGAMKAAMLRTFNIRKEYLKAPAIVEWMQSAPVALVEYEGYLPNEKPKHRDRRMELHSVYHGNIKGLVDHLRNLDKSPEARSLSKWEIIFTYYKGISDVQEVIARAKTQTVFGNNETNRKEVPQSKEELPISQSSSNEDIQKSKSEEPVLQEKPTETEVTSHEKSSVEEENHVEMPTGSVVTSTESSLYNNTIKENKIMEVNNMSGVNELLAAANAANSDAGREQVAPVASNVKSGNKASAEAKEKVTSILAETKAQANEYVKNNTVSALIAPQKPNALRVKSNMGKAFNDNVLNNEEELNKKLSEKISKFITAVSGRQGITLEQFEALSDAERYANVVVTETNTNGAKKAAAIYNLYKQIKANPSAEYAAYIPGPDKVSYATKGYMIGSKVFTVDEFIVELLDNTMGGIYGEGSIDANGNAIGDKPVAFKIASVQTSERDTQAGIAAKKAPRKLVVRPQNKKEFINGGAHVVFLMTQESEDETGRASFKAAIDVDGAIMPATVSVYALDNEGNKIIRSEKKDKDGKQVITYRTKVASCSLSVPVTKIIRTIGTEFLVGEKMDADIDGRRWNVTLGSGNKGAISNVDSVKDAAGIDVFAFLFQGDIAITDTIAKSNVYNKLKAASDAQIAQEAQESSEALE